MLRGPSKVPRLETEGTELFVTTASADGVDTLGAELGQSGLTAELELSLFAVVSALGARGGSLVPRGASDTCSLGHRVQVIEINRRKIEGSEEEYRETSSIGSRSV